MQLGGISYSAWVAGSVLGQGAAVNPTTVLVTSGALPQAGLWLVQLTGSSDVAWTYNAQWLTGTTVNAAQRRIVAAGNEDWIWGPFQAAKSDVFQAIMSLVATPTALQMGICVTCFG